ncbi:MAG: hypothetical protein V2A69_16155 [Pseudomonadota bacterium]
MYKTIKAIYKNGKIIPIKEIMPIKEARVLITILDKDNRGKKEGKGRFETCPYNIINYDIKYRMGREILDNDDE